MAFGELNLIVIYCRVLNPTQVTELISVETTLQLLTLSIYSGWLRDMSYIHWRVTGKSITKLPLNGIAVLGVMLINMSPVVLVMDGLKVRPQDVN